MPKPHANGNYPYGVCPFMSTIVATPAKDDIIGAGDPGRLNVAPVHSPCVADNCQLWVPHDGEGPGRCSLRSLAQAVEKIRWESVRGL